MAVPRVNQFVFEAATLTRPSIRVNQFVFEIAVLPMIGGPLRITFRGVKRVRACASAELVEAPEGLPPVKRAV